jgi:hypothetical protein
MNQRIIGWIVKRLPIMFTVAAIFVLDLLFCFFLLSTASDITKGVTVLLGFLVMFLLHLLGGILIGMEWAEKFWFQIALKMAGRE